MPETVNRQVILKSRPAGEPTEDNFALVEAPVPEPGPGQILARTIYLSLDPYMRGRMSDAQVVRAARPSSASRWSAAPSARSSESQHPGFAAGDFVLGYDGWQDVRRLGRRRRAQARPGSMAPISTALGVLGMPGMTAYVGLLDIGQPQPGETVVVSAAAGRRRLGRRPDRQDQGLPRRRHRRRRRPSAATWSRSSASTPASTTRRRTSTAALRGGLPRAASTSTSTTSAAPCCAAVLRHINHVARIPLCGLISQYNATEPPPGPNLLPLLVNRALIQGFIVSDHPDRDGRLPARRRPAGCSEGKLKYREDIVDGLENAPRAFIGLLQGENFGKLLVRVGDDPDAGRGRE